VVGSARQRGRDDTLGDQVRVQHRRKRHHLPGAHDSALASRCQHVGGRPAGASGLRKRQDVLRGQSPDLVLQPEVAHRLERRNLSHAGLGDLVCDVVGGGFEPLQEYCCAPVHSLTITQCCRRSRRCRRLGSIVRPYKAPSVKTVAQNVSHRPPHRNNRLRREETGSSEGP